MRFLILFLLVIYGHTISAQYADQLSKHNDYPIEEEILSQNEFVEANPFDYSVETHFNLLPKAIQKQLIKISLNDVIKILEVQPNENLNMVSYMVYSEKDNVVSKFHFDQNGILLKDKSFVQPAHKDLTITKVANKDRNDLY